MTIKQLFKTAPLTTLLLISFICLYILQVLTGVDANSPTTEALLYWGANALPFSMGDQPWRLVSSGFLHIGLMHLLFNGFAMYFFGQVAEPMFGSSKFLALFLLAVIGGNLLNNQMTWLSILDGTGQPGLSAGASGGIMGIGAALLVAALFKISVNNMVLNLKSLVLVMGINLVYGFAVPGIDNAGHIGGAITGAIMALGFGLAYRQRLKAQLAAIPVAVYRTEPPSTMYSTEPAVNSTDSSHFNKDSAHLDNTNQSYTVDRRIYTNNNVNNPVNLADNTSINQAFDPADLNSNIGADVHSDASDDPQITNSYAAVLAAKPAMLWQLLPWIIMIIIAIGFSWWWLDIHNQILKVLAAQ